jgi:leucyl aminopeptidase
MKSIMKVNLALRHQTILSCKTDVLAVGLFSGSHGLDPVLAPLDKRLSGALSRLKRLGDFKAEVGTSVVVYGNEKIPATRVLVVGLGDPNKIELETLRKAAIAAASRAVSLKAQRLSLSLHRGLPRRLDLAEVGKVLAEGACFGSYRYDEYVTGQDRPTQIKIELIENSPRKARSLERGFSTGTVIGQACNWARTLANRPGNVIHPAELAAMARQVSRNSRHLTCTVFDERQLATLGMGGILAVGSGSTHKPRLIALRHTRRPGIGRRPSIALVGKAITFDSGGVSIKPSADMDQMKLDKSGGVAVIATLKAIDELGLDLNVLGLIPAAENLPSGTSYRPGDILTTYSGKTVEVLNTDAEGRLILCDALAYAVQQGCNVLVDIATLTGACMVALGKVMAGLMGNDEQLLSQIQQAAQQSGEKVWTLPCGEEYADEMKSKIADLKNTGGKWGGACTAAAFLRQFVGDTKWAHLDIAGVDVLQSPSDSGAPGASGFGVRLLTTFLMNLAEQKKL